MRRQTRGDEKLERQAGFNQLRACPRIETGGCKSSGESQLRAAARHLITANNLLAVAATVTSYLARHFANHSAAIECSCHWPVLRKTAATLPSASTEKGVFLSTNGELPHTVQSQGAIVNMAARVLGLHPMGGLGQPNEVAQAVLCLCSKGASFTAGPTLPVDGGFLMPQGHPATGRAAVFRHGGLGCAAPRRARAPAAVRQCRPAAVAGFPGATAPRTKGTPPWTPH